MPRFLNEIKATLLVRSTRLELVRFSPHAPQTCAYASSATTAGTAKGSIAAGDGDVKIGGRGLLHIRKQGVSPRRRAWNDEHGQMEAVVSLSPDADAPYGQNAKSP